MRCTIKPVANLDLGMGIGAGASVQQYCDGVQ